MNLEEKQRRIEEIKGRLVEDNESYCGEEERIYELGEKHCKWLLSQFEAALECIELTELMLDHYPERKVAKTASEILLIRALKRFEDLL